MVFSDLIDEQICDSADEGVLGKIEYRGSFGAKIFRARLSTREDCERYQKEAGRYSTILISPIIHSYSKARRYVANLLSEELLSYLPHLGKHFCVLVVGLGNAFVVSDSLGARVIKNLLPTHNLPTALRDGLGDMACLIPGVSGMNGIPTFDLVRSAVDVVKPDIVIIIDALTARNYQRIGNSFQLSDTSICPGAGVGNKNQVLNKASLGADIITLGVPMMINAKNFSQLDELPNIVLTPKEIDFYAQTCSTVIAEAINKAIHGKNYQKYI